MRARHVLSIAALAVATSGLAACGTHHEGGTASPPKATHTSAPVKQQPAPPKSSRKPVVVELPGSENHTVQLVVGQQLTVKISNTVSIQPTPSTCTKESPTSVLQRLCDSTTTFSYQALRPGTSSVLFTVKPKCSKGAVCPDWVRQANLSVHVVKA